MTETQGCISDRARDYADRAELAYAMEASLFGSMSKESAHSISGRQWLGLSTWARNRELRRANNELLAELEQLRSHSEALAVEAQKLRQRCVTSGADLRDVLREAADSRHSETVYRLGQLTAMHDAACQAFANWASAQSQYAEACEAVSLARQRADFAYRHFRELSQVRRRASSKGFLLALSAIALGALLLHWSLAVPN